MSKKTGFYYLLWCSLLILACASEEKDMTTRGYPYKMHHDAEGTVIAPGEYAYFHITMRAGDSVLNSSYSMGQIPRLRIPAPNEFTRETSVIIDGLAKMSVGDSLTLFYPLDSLGPTRPPAFQNFDIIEYDLSLKEIKSDQAFKQEQQIAMAEREKVRTAVVARKDDVAAFANTQLQAYQAGNIKDLQKTDLNLEYVIHEQGEGARAANGRSASVQYYGMLVSDGSVFDESFSQGNPYTFTLGQGGVIKGWDVGIPLLNKGGSASLFIPYELAYGEAGRPGIPPKAKLYFYVELQDLN